MAKWRPHVMWDRAASKHNTTLPFRASRSVCSLLQQLLNLGDKVRPGDIVEQLSRSLLVE
jgi:hypothetical protein